MTPGQRIAADVYWSKPDGPGSKPDMKRLAELIDEAVDAQRYRASVNAEKLAKLLASALASGWEGETFQIRDMRKWTDDVKQALDVCLGRKR